MTDPTQCPIRSLVLGRRDFCSKLALGSAGAFVAAAAPFSPALATLELNVRDVSFGGSSPDDVFGHCPPYAEPIGFGRAHAVAMATHTAEFPYWV